jgi:tRNA U34 5-methylaminomethyl-2-thiouridine-forming methyltransferase MnmC
MREMTTADGSITFFNEQYDEPYHSLTGAVEEAFGKYAIPCRASEYAKSGKVRILDVCFGLGYNSAAALDMIWEENPDCFVEVTALENDEAILRKVLEVNPRIDSYCIIKNSVAGIMDKYSYSEPRLLLKIIIGDAREEIKKLDWKFDLIFHDPFSPKKCPELWTEEFFRDERRLISDQGILATFSCARMVRDNLARSGFIVKDGPSIGRKAPSTLASPNFLNQEKIS